MSVFAIGQISNIKDEKKWLEYKSKVKATLDAYGAKVLFRGTKVDIFVKSSEFKEIVAIEFDSIELANSWFNSSEYQSIVSIREKGADVTLELYE